MSYKLKLRGAIGADVRRIAEGEISRAIKELTSGLQEEVVKATHDARKHFPPPARRATPGANA
jgi:hypothetical protein